MRPVWSGQRAQHSSVHACVMLRWAEDCAGKYACTKTRIDGWIDWLPLSQLCRQRAVVFHRYHAPLRVLLLHPAQPDCLRARLAQHLVRSLPTLTPLFASRLRRTPSSPAASAQRMLQHGGPGRNVAPARESDELDSGTTERRSRAQAQTMLRATAHPHDFKKVIEQPDDVPKQQRADAHL